MDDQYRACPPTPARTCADRSLRRPKVTRRRLAIPPPITNTAHSSFRQNSILLGTCSTSSSSHNINCASARYPSPRRSHSPGDKQCQQSQKHAALRYQGLKSLWSPQVHLFTPPPGLASKNILSIRTLRSIQLGDLLSYVGVGFSDDFFCARRKIKNFH